MIALLLLALAQDAPSKPDTLVVPITPAGPTVIAPTAPTPSSSAKATTREIPIAPAQAPETVDEQEVRVRILDLVEIDGVRSNQLEGLGLVTGLNSTGDKGAAARQAVSNFVKRNHMNVDATDVDIGNVALVTVTCRMPPFAKLGTTVDVAVQSMNGASSLFGGQLLQTPLVGADGEVYVVAQGAVPVGAISASGKSASVTVNHPTVGRITGGGIVEKEVPMQLLAPDGAMHLHLRSPSYVTASRVAAEIARAFKLPTRALDAATVRVALSPAMREDAVGFVASLGEHEITPAESAVVVVNERTGTIVAGSHVRISTVAVTHGNLTVSIAESQQVSQPLPFSDGQTAATDRTELTTEQEQRGLQIVPGGTSVAQLATALNRMGVSPRDLVAIFQALAEAGALHARLEIV